MTHQEAVNLISNLTIENTPQTWLDLGCGSGTFTLALATLLPNGSKVIGVDNQFQRLPKTAKNSVFCTFSENALNSYLEPNKHSRDFSGIYLP